MTVTYDEQFTPLPTNGGEQADMFAEQLPIDDSSNGARGSDAFRDPAFMANRDAPVHRWVPWIAGYSKLFVADALARFTNGSSVVLDPFSGVGTTLVEADLAGHRAVGFEINPYAVFVARTKLRAHRVLAMQVRDAIRAFEDFNRRTRREGSEPALAPPAGFRTRAPFYSPKVQRKVLLSLEFLHQQDKPVGDLFRLAFAATMVDYSNYSYEPSLGRKAAVGRADVNDFPVMETLAAKVGQIASDVTWYRRTRVDPERPDGCVYEGSFFDGYQLVERSSVDLLVTSPPYLNNYHYNRNTRPHLYWLGFCQSPHDLKRLWSR